MRSVADPTTLAKLEARLRAVTPESQRRWGSLEPGEMLCHLGDSATSVLGRPGGEAGPTRRFLKWVALSSPLPWPKGRPTLAKVDPRREGTRPADFAQDLERAIESLRAVAAAPAEALPAGPLIFGAMSRADWRRWAYRHTDHHLRQFGV